MFEKKNILGVGITNASRQSILEYIIRGLEKDGKKQYLVTVNPEILMLAWKNNNYKSILNRANLALADGIGIVLAGKLLGKALKERITGVDLLENLCKMVSEKPITVGFLGGSDGVAEKTAECLREKYPGLKISFVGEEWLNEQFGRLQHVADDARQVHSSTLSDSASLSERLLQAKRKSAFSSSASGQAPFLNTKYLIRNTIDILFVAFGAPKQEIWISENLDKIPVKFAMGVGGAFDYISEKVSRAPLLIRLMGFEWLFRLIHQPWRWKRQLALPKFIFLVFKEKLK